MGSNGQHSFPAMEEVLARQKKLQREGRKGQRLGGLCILISTRGHLSPILLASQVMAWGEIQPCTAHC